jgi:hypothetical protein
MVLEKKVWMELDKCVIIEGTVSRSLKRFLTLDACGVTRDPGTGQEHRARNAIRLTLVPFDHALSTA